MYKNECPIKNCAFKQKKSKFSKIGARKDLTVNEFNCNSTGKKRIRLISDERIICSKYKECGINCLLKTTYITPSNFKQYFGYEPHTARPFKCCATGKVLDLRLVEENAGSYISIWKQPNLFVKKTAREE